MAPVAETIIERLDAARQKWWLVSLLTTVVLALCVSFGTAMAFMLADSLLQLPQWTLACLLAAWLATDLRNPVRRSAGVCLRGQRSIEAAARRVETEFPELGKQSHQYRPAFGGQEERRLRRSAKRPSTSGGRNRSADVPFRPVRPSKESRWRRFLYCMQTPRDLARIVRTCWRVLVVLPPSSAKC